LRLSGGAQADAELKVGAPFTLEAEVYASAPQRVRATLYHDGVEDLGPGPGPGNGHRDLDLAPGRNLLRFRSEVRAAGFASYRLLLSGADREPGQPGAPLRDRFADN